MTVGELRALLEFVSDDTEIYKTRMYTAEAGDELVQADVRLDFVKTILGRKYIADSDDLVSEEIGLVV